MRPNSTLQNQTSADLYLWIMSSIPARTVRNEIQLLSVEQKAVLAIVKEPQLCLITTMRPNSTLQNQTSADLYLWIMSSIPARTVRNEIQLLSVEQKGRFGHS